MHKLHIDGSHSVDLKIAGIGGVLFDENNNEVWIFAEPLNATKRSFQQIKIELETKGVNFKN